MSFGIAELAVQAVIQEGLTNLRRNPHHLEYILGKYCSIPYVAKRVGPEFIKNAMIMILKSELTTRPYYTENIDQYPILILASSYTEDQKFLGDFGGYDTEAVQKQAQFSSSPTIYATFDSVSIVGDEMSVHNDYGLADKLFSGVYVFGSDVYAQVKGIKKEETKTVLYLDRKFPKKTTLKGWKASTMPVKMFSITNSSTNSVTVQISLFTSGDPELHRVYAQVIRYCLKRGRKYMEGYGLYDSSFSQEPMTVMNDEGLIFRTGFGMQCIEEDEWIEMDITTINRVELEVVANSLDPTKEPV